MIIINDFSGGLRSRIIDNKLEPVFAKKFENINHSRLALIPVNTPEEVVTPIATCDRYTTTGSTTEEHTVLSEYTYTLGWATDVVYQNMFRDTTYYIAFRLYNPTTNKYTQASLPIPIPGKYNSDVSHTLNVDISPKFNQQLYDDGYTEIQFCIAFMDFNSNMSVGVMKPYRVTDKQSYSNNTYTLGDVILTDEVNVDVFNLSYSSCYPPPGPEDDWAIVDCCVDGFNNDDAQLMLLYTREVQINGLIMGQTLPVNKPFVSARNASSFSYKVGTKALPNSKHSVYLFKNNAWRLLWEGVGNAPMTGELQDSNVTLTIPCDVERTDLLPTKTTVDVTNPDMTSSCDDIVSIDTADKWYYSENLRSIIPLRSNEYAIDYNRYSLLFGEKNLLRRFDKSYWVSLGIKAPTISLQANPSGDQEFKFVATLYNNDLDIESGPSNRLVFNASSGNFVFNIDTDVDVNYNRLRIYVLTDGLLAYTLLDEFVYPNGSNSVSVSFTTIDDIVGKTILLKSNSDLALPNLKYPIVIAGIVVGCIDNKLYFSEQGDPTSWPAENYIEFTQEITGIGKTRQGVVVFTLEETYIIVGTSVKTFAKYTISAEIGCINGETVKPFNSGIAFVSYHGIYWTDGSKITSLTDKLLGKLYLNNVVEYAAATNGSYIAILKTDDIFSENYYDIENKRILLEITSTYNLCIKTSNEDAKFIGPINDEFAITKQDNKIYLLYPRNSPNKTMHYTSGILTPIGYSINKVYKDVYISYKAPIHIKILGYDNSTIHRTLLDIDLPEDKTQYNMKLLNGHNIYGFSIEIIGSGEVYEISFNTKDRT